MLLPRCPGKLPEHHRGWLWVTRGRCCLSFAPGTVFRTNSEGRPKNNSIEGLRGKRESSELFNHIRIDGLGLSGKGWDDRKCKGERPGPATFGELFTVWPHFLVPSLVELEVAEDIPHLPPFPPSYSLAPFITEIFVLSPTAPEFQTTKPGVSFLHLSLPSSRPIFVSSGPAQFCCIPYYTGGNIWS